MGRQGTNLTPSVDNVSPKDGLGIMLWVALMLLVAGLVLIVSSGGWAQPTTQNSRPVLHAGQVTSKGTDSIQINNKDYKLAAEATIQDDAGKTRTLNDIKEGMQIQFHAKRDQVDKLVIILPR